MEEAKFDEHPSVLQKLQKWGDYDAFGEPVEPTRFIPMKTPLGQEIIEHWDNDTPPRCPLTLDILVAAQRKKGRKLGMIIDLSNHETLYAADLQAYDIIYERVPLVAKILPRQQDMNKVIAVAEKFWSEHPEEYIGIHCAYGFNRTGFSVCSYLIQACNMSVEEALESFAAARPPGVRHEQFVEELHKRYDGRKATESMSHAESFSELRGYSRQTIDSLKSEFGTVAQHLTDQHPSVANGYSGVTSARMSSDTMGGSPCVPILESSLPTLASTFQHPHSMSGKSLDAPLSHCESVTNESLDLDERDIFRHFNSKSSSSLNSAAQPNRHRRARLSNLAPPEPVGEEESLSSHNSSPAQSKIGRSPFSTIQDSEEMFQITAIANNCSLPTASGESATTHIAVEDERTPEGNPAIDSNVRVTNWQQGDKGDSIKSPFFADVVSGGLEPNAIGEDHRSVRTPKEEHQCRDKHCTIM